MSDNRVGAPVPPRSSAPQSGVYFQVVISEVDAGRRGEEPRVQVRCFGCHRRLFDVSEVRYFADEYGMVSDGSLRIERKCHTCKRLNRGVVTASPGDPWVAPGGLEGPWLCGCGKSLGYVEPVRGRLKTSCSKCHAVIRAIGADAISVASIPTRPVPHVPEVEPLDHDPTAETWS